MKKILHILGQFRDSDIQWIEDVARSMTLEPGERLIEIGGEPEAVFIVIEGELAVSHPQGGLIAHLRGGEMVGEMSFLDERPPDVAVDATQKTTLVAITAEEIHEHFVEDRGFEGRFYRALALFLASRLRGTQNRLAYGKPEALNEDASNSVELDPASLEAIQRAGGYFEQIRARFMHR